MPTAPADPPSELSKLQFDYAWKWFAYHADQRVKMFNYMLLGIGLFATAIVGTLDKSLPVIVPVSLCYVAAFLALSFAFIDGRNQFLLRLSEEVLFRLEAEVIFGVGIHSTDRNGEEIPYGILLRQVGEDQKYLDCRLAFNVLRGKHRFWLRAISISLATTFIVAAFLIKSYGVHNGLHQTLIGSSYCAG